MKNATNFLVVLLLFVVASVESKEAAKKAVKRNNNNENRRANVPQRMIPVQQPAPYQYYDDSYQQQQPQRLPIQYPNQLAQQIYLQQPRPLISYPLQPQLQVPGYPVQYGYQNQQPYAFGMG